MNKKIRAIGAGILVALWVTLTGFMWFGPRQDVSASERRPLDQMPEITLESIWGGSFMGAFEDFTLDQFPLRDTFRTLKSLYTYGVMQQKDNNGIYIVDGYAAKLDAKLNETSINYALKIFNNIYKQNLEGTNVSVYMAVIPDKGYYLAEQNGYPAMDYEKLFTQMEEGMSWATPIDLTGVLDVTDYYYTDTHWRQEKILDAAGVLSQAMGVTAPKAEDYTPTLMENPFYGVYYGQAALPMDAEDLYIMKSRVLDACKVYNHETKRYQRVYDMQKLFGSDPYDVFLSGAQALLTIENPKATTNKELIMFRDSFGSSMSPLLVENYKKVTLVDLRYMSSSLLSQYIRFTNQDVLFMYSTLILNSSGAMK